MVCEALDIVRETYLAIMMDRKFKGPVIVASPEGGVDIEEVAEARPEKILTVSLCLISKHFIIEIWLQGILKLNCISLLEFVN